MAVLIGGNVMCIIFAGEGANEYDIGVCMEGNHDVLVPTVCSRMEAAGVIGEDLVKWEVNRSMACCGSAGSTGGWVVIRVVDLMCCCGWAM